MSGNIPQVRKSFTKIKNFTEKDQVRIKYSLLGKEKKLMLSVYIGEDVYNQLTDGKEYKRLNTTYIPGDMVVISPTNDDKGLIHRYNGSGMFKTTCVRISLGKMKGLKLSKRDLTNRVVEYSVLHGGIDEPSNALRIDISNSKKIRFTVKPQEKLDADKTQVFNTYEDTNLGYLSKPYIEKERYCSQLITPLGERVLGPSEETVLTNTKADKSTYIPRMDHKLDEINEKVDEIIKNQKSLSEAIFSVHELLTSNEKDEHNKPDIDIRNSYDSNIAKQKIEGAPIPYIPFNDLDEIHEKIYEINEKQEYIAKQVKDFNNTNHDISYRLSLLLQELEKNKEKDDHNRPDIDRRIAFLEARFSSVELRLDHLNNKSLFGKIFGGK